MSRGALIVALALTSACRSGVTPARLEGALASTFANLVESQETLMELPRVAASDLRASASCEKPQGHAGGEWRCTVTWFVPRRRVLVHDTYELTVAADGCYTAAADPSEAHVGGPRVTTPGGKSMTNLLYAFEGCFDTSWPERDRSDPRTSDPAFPTPLRIALP